MIKKAICFAVIAALPVIGAAVSCGHRTNSGHYPAISQEVKEAKEEPKAPEKKYLAERHKDCGMECGVCHNGEESPKTAATQKACLVCHNSLDSVAGRTNADKGYKFNPHRNHITETNVIECTQCHQAHKADTVVCYNCHQGMKLK